MFFPDKNYEKATTVQMPDEDHEGLCWAMVIYKGKLQHCRRFSEDTKHGTLTCQQHRYLEEQAQDLFERS